MSSILSELIKNYYPDEVYVKKPYIIAEAGVNHEGSMDLAKRLINEAKEGGADAIKFQSYKAEFLASKNSPAYWDTSKEPTKSQFDLFKKYDKFWKKEFEQLKRYCEELHIEFLSTPFDTESATFLNDLMDVFKIASSDITNKPFIEYICQFGKPLILSTGASYLWEICEAVSWIRKYGNNLALLHCVLNYPTREENANLGRIVGLRLAFPDVVVGYSDHTLPNDMKSLEIAVLLGSRIIEKHFTFDKNLPGNDHYHAMDKNDLKLFKKHLDKIFKLLGSFKVQAFGNEEMARQNARRSLIAKKDIPKGKIIDLEDIICKRPGTGISPKFIDEVLGKRCIRNIQKDSIIQWAYLNEPK